MPRIRNAVGSFTTVGTGTSQSAAVPNTDPSAILVGFAFFPAGGGTRSFDSNGAAHTWGVVVDDTINRQVSACLAPTAGTNQVTAAGTSASHITWMALEIVGMNPAGAIASVPFQSFSLVTQWAADMQKTKSPALLINFCTQGTNGTMLASPAPGWSPVLGTGISNGMVQNANEGDVIFAQYRLVEPSDFGPNGSWDTALNMSATTIVIPGAEIVRADYYDFPKEPYRSAARGGPYA